MTKLQWNTPGSRLYETGVDRGVLYVGENPGVPWNGLTNVSEQPTGGSVRSYFIDGVNYLNLIGRETFQASLTAFFSPPEFDVCDGTVELAQGFSVTQQRRQPFGFSYRTRIGNDLQAADYGYKIHLIYNALAAPSQKSYDSMNSDPETSDLSWTIVAKPRKLLSAAPGAHFIIDSTTTSNVAMAMLEDILYGTDVSAPRLPTPEEIITLIQEVTVIFTVTDNGNGTFTIDGDADTVIDNGDGTVTLDSLSVTDNGDGTLTATSL